MRSATTRIAATTAALVATAAIGACHGASPEEHPDAASSSAAPASSAHNAQDVAFLQAMLPHHQQALELAAMVPTRTADAQLIALAQQIAGAQRPEIDAFRAQLLQWEQPTEGQHPMAMDGMVDEATMGRLKTLNGSDFDTLWLQSMIAHHRGAITMAKTEIADGKSPDVVGIARSIATTQQAEVDQMNRMLGGDR